ncbi:GspH/FimT family pseudopilin [Litoribacillus peritrichatus]|uniref:Type II secretion system protein H n=1 Tax=Litoribacillus peritrichatus TaxID=718191 RepID=A0ABP7NB50_9GAMM
MALKNHFNKYSSQTGFSLIELMVTLGVLGALLVAAFPGFNELITGQRLKTQTNDTLTAVLFAKSEAIKRRSSVTICAMKTNVENQCGASGTEWANGWIVFDDIDADGIVDNGEDILKFNGDYDRLTSKSTISAITLDEQGAANASVDIEFCFAEANGDKARNLAMAAIGSPVISSKENCS